MTASVEIITTRKSDVLSVPLQAVTTRNPDEKSNKKPGSTQDDDDEAPKVVSEKDKKPEEENKVVVFVNDKGVAKMVEVETGISDYDNIEITNGLSDSTEVITGPFLVVSRRLKDGDKIRKAVAKKEDKSAEEKD
jgi:HlyD family secretion protein